MSWKTTIAIILLLVSLLVLSSCTAGDSRFEQAKAGFWSGLWHGIIAPFAFIVSLFNDHVFMYEVNNVGRWYDFGFLLGVMMFWGGCHHSHRCVVYAPRRKQSAKPLKVFKFDKTKPRSKKRAKKRKRAKRR